MKSDDEKVLGKGIEAIFERTAHLAKDAEKSIELPNGVIVREGDDLTIRLKLGEDDDIRGSIEVLMEMAQNGLLDELQDKGKIRSQIVEHLEMAQLAMEDGDINSAIDELENCLRINDIPTVRFNLAVLLERSKKTDKAMREYRKVLRGNPNDVEALNNLGKLYYAKGDFTRAMSMYEKAVKLRPSISENAKDGLFGRRFGFRKLTE